MRKNFFGKLAYYILTSLFYFYAVAYFAKGSVLLLILGGIIGILLMELERPLSRLLTQPQNKPVLHNIYFQGIIIALSFYVVGFFPSSFNFGLIMGLFLHLILDITGDYFDEEKFLTWFWILKEPKSRFIQRMYFTFILFIFIYFTIFFISISVQSR